MQNRETWRLFELTTRQGKCRHASTGNAPAGKMCVYCYECARCPYDQMLEDMDHVAQPRHQPTQVALSA